MTVDDLIRRWEQARAARGNWDGIFQEIADRVLPQAADFNARQSDGAKRTDLMYDATAALALQKFTAAIESFATPRNQRWHTLEVNDPALQKNQNVKRYLEEVTELLFKVRYSPRAAFAAQTNETYLSFGAFGTAGIFIDDDIKARVIRYKSLALASTWFLENHHGLVDTVFRCFKRTLRQIEQRWPGKLPEKLRQRLEKYPDEQHEIVHFVGPQVDYEPSKLGSMPWASCYFMPGEKHKLDEGGFLSWPFGVARYMTAADEIYGRSPAWLALSNIKVLNEQKKTHIKAGHKAVDPPLLVHEDGILQAFSMTPGYLNFGGINSAGQEMVKPLQVNPRLDISLEMMDREREIIGQAFLIDVFRALVENPQMTATQAMELISERAVLVSPVLGRLQTEFLGSVIDREIAILAHAGQMPEMPPELEEAAGEYRVEYTSPMSKAMRAGDGVAIMRTLEAVTPLAQVDPTVLDAYDLPALARELGEINGVPAKAMRSAEDVERRAADREQAAQMHQLVDAAPSVTAAASNLVKLQRNAGVPLPG